MSNFPKTLAAAKTAENTQWAIGDALLKEATDKYVGKRGLNAVVQELSENGIEYSASTLSMLRTVAEAFRPNRRHNLPVAVHVEAGNPDTLDVIAKVAKKEGEKPTKWYVRRTVIRLREQFRLERQEKKAAAQREHAEAEAEEETARKKVLQAKDDTERQRAHAEREKATIKRRAAADKVKAVKVAPKKSEITAPKEEDVPALVAITGLIADAGEAQRLAKKNHKRIEKHVDQLTQGYIAGLTEAAMDAANAWIAIANLIRSATPNKRGHLSVVNE